MSTSPDASLSPIPLDIPDSGEAVPSEVNSASDPDRDLAINQIAAAIRGARTESGFIPVGPERKRLTNLIRFWMVAIPAVVVFVDIVIKILVHYVSFNEFKAVVGLLALAANGDGHGLPFVLFFLPLGFVFISGLLAIVTAGLALVFSTSPTKRWGSRCVYAVFSLSAVANVGMIIGAAGADFATYVIIFLTSAYVITLASFVYWLISIITRSGRTPWDYTVVATVCLVVTCATVSMLLGIDAYNESQGNGKSASENLRGEGTPEMLDATGDTLNGRAANDVGPKGEVEPGQGGSATETATSDSPSDEYWFLAIFGAPIILGVAWAMATYHWLMRWKAEWNTYSRLLNKIALTFLPGEFSGDGKSRDKACLRIGNWLGPGLSRSVALDYSVFIGSASGICSGKLWVPASVTTDSVLGAAFGEGVRAVFVWCGTDRHRWSLSAYEFVYVQVTHGIARYLYKLPVDGGDSLPVSVAPDILACSRLLAIEATDAIYRANLQRLVARRSGRGKTT